MKTILLWDPRFPNEKPRRLTVDDTLASAAVRSGVAAAASPAEQGGLAVGGPLDPGQLTEVVLQHGRAGGALVRAMLPFSVVLVAAALGLCASIGVPVGGAPVVPTPTPTPTAVPLNIALVEDIDIRGERDDIAANALWFASQEHFTIRTLIADAPDSDEQEYRNEIIAYEADLPRLLSQTAYPERFKSGDQLRAMIRQGSKVDAPAKGYWASGDSGYAAPHAAAQDLIAAAQAYGDPNSSDPAAKLWVIVQGGYTSVAQAAYEAVQLGQLPDFFKRVRIIGQPNYNSWWAQNAWNYLFSRIWPAEGTPGLFGDAWMLNGYLQWHAFNRDNGGSDTTFWNRITDGSAMGAHLRATLTRPNGAFTTPHFRAGDAGTWLWLISAKMSGNYSPTNAANWCGAYRTYEGRAPWPSRTVGYGTAVNPQYSNPEGITWSPTMWAPDLSVVGYDQAYAAVNLAKWYEVAEEVMSRYYRTDGTTATSNVALPGSKQPAYALRGPASGTVGEPIPYQADRYGAAPAQTVTLALSDGSTATWPAGTASPLTINRTPVAAGPATLALVSASPLGLVSTKPVAVGVVEAGTPTPPATPFVDTYTSGTNGQDIGSRPTDSGHIYVKTGSPGILLATGSGTAYPTAANALYEVRNADGTDFLTGDNFNVGLDLLEISNSPSNTLVRFYVTDNLNYVSLGYNTSAGLRIGQKINNTFSTLGSPVPLDLAANPDPKIWCEVRGGVATVFLDGAAVMTNVALPSGLGRKGGLEGGGTVTSTTRTHFDRVVFEPL